MFVYEVEVSNSILDLSRSMGLFKTKVLAKRYVDKNNFYQYNILQRLVKENIGDLELQNCEGSG